MPSAGLAGPPLAASLLRPIAPGLAGKLAARHARGYLERLFEINSARVINDFQERLVESRRQLQAEVERLRAERPEPAARAAPAGDRASGWAMGS